MSVPEEVKQRKKVSFVSAPRKNVSKRGAGLPPLPTNCRVSIRFSSPEISSTADLLKLTCNTAEILFSKFYGTPICSTVVIDLVDEKSALAFIRANDRLQVSPSEGIDVVLYCKPALNRRSMPSRVARSGNGTLAQDPEFKNFVAFNSLKITKLPSAEIQMEAVHNPTCDKPMSALLKHMLERTAKQKKKNAKRQQRKAPDEKKHVKEETKPAGKKKRHNKRPKKPTK